MEIDYTMFPDLSEIPIKLLSISKVEFHGQALTFYLQSWRNNNDNRLKIFRVPFQEIILEFRNRTVLEISFISTSPNNYYHRNFPDH